MDKAMMAGDSSLVSMETMLETRIAAASALAFFMRFNHKAVSPPYSHQMDGWLTRIG